MFMDRKPPASVRKFLRQEVGFGCPVPGCGNPYLEWHHFDPPFSDEPHHRPEGMIALCATHHKKADGGAFTIEQLRDFKNNKAHANTVRGQFDWLRNDLLAYVGGNFFYETLRILSVDGTDVIWFNRDDEGYLRLNVRMLSVLARERAIIEENAWANIGDPVDLQSPPQGKDLRIEYKNGDYLRVSFFVLSSANEAFEKYQVPALLDTQAVKYPITTVEVHLKIGGTGIELNPGGTSIQTNSISRCFMSHCGCGISLNLGIRWRENPSLLPFIPSSRLTRCPCGSGLRFKHCHGLLRD